MQHSGLSCFRLFWFCSTLRFRAQKLTPPAKGRMTTSTPSMCRPHEQLMPALQLPVTIFSNEGTSHQANHMLCRRVCGCASGRLWKLSRQWRISSWTCCRCWRNTWRDRGSEHKTRLGIFLMSCKRYLHQKLVRQLIVGVYVVCLSPDLPTQFLVFLIL